jgi:hypothetical protein
MLTTLVKTSRPHEGSLGECCATPQVDGWRLSLRLGEGSDLEASTHIGGVTQCQAGQRLSTTAVSSDVVGDCDAPAGKAVCTTISRSAMRARSRSSSCSLSAS